MIKLMVYAVLFFIMIAAGVFLLAANKKKSGKKGTKDLSGEAYSGDRGMADLIPIRRYDRANGYYILEDGTSMDLFQVRAKDLINASDDEVEYDCMRFAKFYKTYADDIKIVSLNYPCNTARQQEYLRKKLENTNNPNKRYWINRKLEEEIWIEENKSTREFYFMCFASCENMDKNKRKIISTLQTGTDGLIIPMTPEKKEQILYKLNNKNAMLKAEVRGV